MKDCLDGKVAKDDEADRDDPEYADYLDVGLRLGAAWTLKVEVDEDGAAGIEVVAMVRKAEEGCCERDGSEECSRSGGEIETAGW